MTSLFWFNFPSKMSSETEPPINGLDEASPVLHVDAGENEEGDEEGVLEEPQTTGQCHDQQFMVCYIMVYFEIVQETEERRRKRKSPRKRKQSRVIRQELDCRSFTPMVSILRVRSNYTRMS